MKTIFFPLYFFHITRFHSVTSNSKSFSPAATLDPRPRLWTRDRDIGPATASLDPRLRLWTRDPRPATRDPRLLVKLARESRAVTHETVSTLLYDQETTTTQPRSHSCFPDRLVVLSVGMCRFSVNSRF